MIKYCQHLLRIFVVSNCFVCVYFNFCLFLNVLLRFASIILIVMFKLHFCCVYLTMTIRVNHEYTKTNQGKQKERNSILQKRFVVSFFHLSCYHCISARKYCFVECIQPMIRIMFASVVSVYVCGTLYEY